MKAFWKATPLLALVLLWSALPGCRPAAAPAEAPVLEATAPAVADAPLETPVPTFTPTPEPLDPVMVTIPPTPVPTATPSPTPVPTDTPVPTPTPTPTSVPLARRDFEGEVEDRLFPLWVAPPEPTPTVAPMASPDPRAEGIGQLGAMVFAHVAVYRQPVETAEVLGRESYHLLYIHSLHRNFYYVTTQEGRQGYVKASQVTILSEAEVEAYVSAAAQLGYTADFYSPEAFLREVQSEKLTGSMADRIYGALCRLGLDFEPFYYRVYHKDVADDVKYPLYYKDEIYNSLLFRLFNTVGDMVYYRGQPTQWAYVPASGTLEPGDILFFAEVAKGQISVAEGYEFVFGGRYSGNLTDCGVYLGDDQALLLEDGAVRVVENFSASNRFKSLDSARRIHTSVFDEKQLLIESLIAQIYDCLGTPYANYDQRMGDFSFDCSGLISWLYLRMDMYPAGYDRQWEGTSASGLSNITEYTWKGAKRIHMIRPVETNPEGGVSDLAGFERGDIIFLRSAHTGHVGHVMVYLGEGKVIHSTYINRTYSGTVVANFRRELQRLYYTSLRIESIL